MAMGKAVVSTTVGAEGLPVVDGTHVAIADRPDAFAHAVVALMRDPVRRAALESAARTLVIERYDWSAVAGDLESALERFARGGIRAAVANPQPAMRPSSINQQSAISNLRSSQGDAL
jgi:glycosyltransferase involved in cell wall biosynthesis